MDSLPRLTDLSARTQETELEFLRTDLSLCFTFVDLAGTEATIGDVTAARKVLQKARDGHAAITRLQANIADAAQRGALERELAVLQGAIDAAEARLNSGTHTSLFG